MGTESEQESLASANLAEALKEGESGASENSAFWVDEEVRDVVTFLESIDPSYEETQEHAVLKYRQKSESLKQAVEDGNVSKMQHGVGFVENRKEEQEALPLVVDVLNRGGATVYIWGGQEAGKTHTATWLMDKALKFSNIEAAVTNIPVEDADLEVSQSDDVEVTLNGDVADMDDLEGVDRQRSEVGLRLDGDDVDLGETGVVRVGRETHARAVAAAVDGRVIEALDEWGTKGGGNKGSNPNAGEEMMRHFKEMRHRPFDAAAVVIGHEPSDLEKSGRALLDLGIYKPTQTVAQLFRGVDLDGGTGFITDVSIGGHDLDGYDHKGATKWIFDGGDDENNGMSESEIEARAQALRDAGLSCREIADDEDIPWSRSTVSRRTEAS